MAQRRIPNASLDGVDGDREGEMGRRGRWGEGDREGEMGKGKEVGKAHGMPVWNEFTVHSDFAYLCNAGYPS